MQNKNQWTGFWNTSVKHFWDNSQITTRIAASLLHQHSAFLITKPTSLANGQVLMLRTPSWVTHIFTKLCCSVWLRAIRSFNKNPRENERLWCLPHRKQKTWIPWNVGDADQIYVRHRCPFYRGLQMLDQKVTQRSFITELQNQQNLLHSKDVTTFKTTALGQPLPLGKKFNSKKHQEGSCSCLHLEINSVNLKTLKTLVNSFFKQEMASNPTNSRSPFTLLLATLSLMYLFPDPMGNWKFETCRLGMARPFLKFVTVLRPSFLLISKNPIEFFPLVRSVWSSCWLKPDHFKDETNLLFCLIMFEQLGNVFLGTCIEMLLNSDLLSSTWQCFKACFCETLNKQ